jgi:hypothetical protein
MLSTSRHLCYLIGLVSRTVSFTLLSLHIDLSRNPGESGTTRQAQQGRLRLQPELIRVSYSHIVQNIPFLNQQCSDLVRVLAHAALETASIRFGQTVVMKRVSRSNCTMERR